MNPGNPGNQGPYPSVYPGMGGLGQGSALHPNEQVLANASANGHPSVDEAAGSPTYLLHKSQLPLYAVGFSNRNTDGLVAAVGSFLPSEDNFISILEVPSDRAGINCTKRIPQRYPATMIRFQPHCEVG